MRLEGDGAFWHWIVSVVLTPVGVFLIGLIGGWSPAMTALGIVMILDWISGLARAWQQEGWSSARCRAGIIKKVLCWVVVALAYQVDCVVQAPFPLRDGVAAFFTLSEGLSVLENSAAAGVPIPQFLRDALAQLNERKAPPGASAGAPSA